MNIKLSILLISVSFGLLLLPMNSAYGQQESQYTQYMYNTMHFNPGYTGSRGSLNMTGIYRNQWVGLDGAPKTLTFGMHSPIGVQGVGLGLGFMSDQIGPSSQSFIEADFSYTINVAEELKLSFGVRGGLSLLDVDPSKLLIYDPNDYNLERKNYSSPRVGAGAYLYADNWYVGLSSPNFLETEHFDDVVVATATEKAHFYLMGGYVFTLNPDLKLKPAFLAKAVSGAPLSVDVSANLLMYERVTLGVAWRWDAAVSALAGFQVNDNIFVGYAYDYETTELGRYNHGSHEVFLRFELGTKFNGKVNPRFF